MIAFLASATAAVQAADPYQAFLSTKPEAAAPGDATSRVAVRPNNEATFHVYLTNTTDEDGPAKLTVVLSTDPAGKKALASGSVATLKAKSTAHVAMKSAVDPAPAAAVPAAAPAVPAGEKPADAAPAAAKPLPGTPVSGVLYLVVLDENDKPISDKPADVSVRMLNPREYLYALPTLTRGADGSPTLTVELGDRVKAPSDKADAAFTGPPAKVKLEMRPGLVPNLDAEGFKTGGTFETVVRPNSSDMRLVAKNLRFNGAPGRSIISVSVDGYDRAFVFETNFGGTNPQPLSQETLVRIDCPSYAIPGKPLAAKLEVFNDPSGGTTGKPRLTFERTDGGNPELLTADLGTPRDQQLTARVGKAGELVVASAVKDWVIPIDTAGVYGNRKLEFSLLNAEGEVLTQRVGGRDEKVSWTHTLVLDDTPPELTSFRAILPPITLYGDALEKALKAGPKLPVLVRIDDEDLPAEAERGKDLYVVATLNDDESGIDLTKTLFYLGAPPGPDGKPLPGAKLAKPLAFVPAKLDPKTNKIVSDAVVEGVYFAKFRLPDVKGPVKVGVIYTNRVGQVVEKVAEVIVVDPPEKPTTGAIEGRIIQGSSPERPQPSMPVTLFDAAGAIVASGETNAKGEYRFEFLKPGSYFVFSVKAADQNAKDTKAGAVVAGKTTKVDLELRR